MRVHVPVSCSIILARATCPPPTHTHTRHAMCTRLHPPSRYADTLEELLGADRAAVVPVGAAFEAIHSQPGVCAQGDTGAGAGTQSTEGQSITNDDLARFRVFKKAPTIVM